MGGDVDTSATRREHNVRTILLFFAVVNLAIGLWMLVGAESFQAAGNWGARNDHQVRDFSSAYLAIGTGLLVAARRVSWRGPVLVLAIIQNAVHLVVHVIDQGAASKPWLGWVTIGGLVTTVGVFALLLRREGDRADA